MTHADGSACKLARARRSRFLMLISEVKKHRGSLHTTITEFGRRNHHTSGLFGPNSVLVCPMDPLGSITAECPTAFIPTPRVRSLEPLTKPLGLRGFGFRAFCFGVSRVSKVVKC